MLKNITLEMSLKPFKQTDSKYIRRICRKVAEQWKPLLKQTECVSVLLWCGDGSEILDYSGNQDDTFEWCYFIGGANTKETYREDLDPDRVALHSRSYLYMKNPPVFTYHTLREIVSEIKNAIKELLGDIWVRVGTTFDPGPEFAKSSFKYERHTEICQGNDMGEASMVCAYAFLKGDKRCYAAYPNGIPEGLAFGRFLGKQTYCYLQDMEFDYIWLSNGFGFGRETWSPRGAVFDGKRFYSSELEGIKKDVLGFWRMFREECPDFPIETRGTNFSMAIDYATDGVPLKEIYQGDFQILPPPNSPWAAIDGDFGLELMGYMSRIAILPEQNYLYRFYLHDPWWMNSPWYDRYGSQPHDIYLPLSIARIDEKGSIQPPTHLNILSIDNSLGNSPDSCSNEVIPHLLRAIKEMPDAPPAVVWVYPFEEYSGYKSEQELKEMFFEDWLIRGAINQGFPLSAVTATSAFIQQDKRIYDASVLVSPVPAQNTEYEKQILQFVKSGGRVIFYGNTIRAGEGFLNLVKLTYGTEISGIQDISINGRPYGKINHNSLFCGGGIQTDSDSDQVIVRIGARAAGIYDKNYVWLRGTVSADFEKMRIPVSHKESEFFIGEALFLKALALLGYEIKFEKEPDVKTPVMMLHRYNNAYLFSVYTPSTTVKTKLKFPFGAPILDGYESKLENGYATYHFPKAEHRECRVFVEQKEGIVGCREIPPVSVQYRRRIEVNGLHNATVRFLAEEYCKENVTAMLNSTQDYYCVGEEFEGGYKIIRGISFYEVRNVSGNMVFSMPFQNM